MTVRLLILSDLHLEHGAALTVPTTANYDVVVLAGDINNPGSRAVHWAARESMFGDRPVIYVPGNHEFYNKEMTSELEEMRKAAEGTKVHVLNRDPVDRLRGSCRQRARASGLPRGDRCRSSACGRKSIRDGLQSHPARRPFNPSPSAGRCKASHPSCGGHAGDASRRPRLATARVRGWARGSDSRGDPPCSSQEVGGKTVPLGLGDASVCQ